MTIESDFGEHQERMASLLTRTPEQRYLDLMEQRPDLLQRAPVPVGQLPGRDARVPGAASASAS
ncbi:MAG: hypothetical protein R2810_04935 [Flavobacteriales bacterium]